MDIQSVRLQKLLPYLRPVRRYLPVICLLAVTVAAVLFTRSYYYAKSSVASRKVSSSTVKLLNRQLADIRARIQAQTSTKLDTSKPSPLGPIATSRKALPSRVDHRDDHDRNVTIARSPSEVVELQKRGDRDYQVFQVSKSKRLRRIGPIRVSLKKTDVARQTFDVELESGGVRLQKQSVKRQERLRLPAGGDESVELVINQITEDQVTGYVSMPRTAEQHASF
jgi:hypothetical protein